MNGDTVQTSLEKSDKESNQYIPSRDRNLLENKELKFMRNH